MKQLKHLSILLLLPVILFTACKKDSENPDTNTTGSFTFKGTTYPLDKGFLDYDGLTNNGTHIHEIILVSPGIDFSQSAGDFVGTGEYMNITLLTSTPNGLLSGTYAYSSNRNAFTFESGEIGLGLVFSSNAGTYLDINGGTVNIEVNGAETTVKFSLLTDFNDVITGQFTGKLRSF